MKKHLHLNFFIGVLLFLFVSGTLLAQNTFYKKVGYTNKEYGRFVIETSDGGYAVVGTTNSIGTGEWDVWLLKTDSSGDTLWTKTYGESGDDQGYCLRQTSDGGFIIAGYKTVPDNYKDGWVFKTDAAGNLEWEHVFSSDLNGDVVTSLVNTTDNAFIGCGNLHSHSFAFKIDEEGNVLWEQTYFTYNNSSTTSICRTSDNKYAIAGSFQNTSAGSWYPNIFTIDADGNLGYQLTYMLAGDGIFNFIIATSDDGMVFGGTENGKNVVYKNALSGTEQWNYQYDAPTYGSSVTAATETPDNNIVITDNTFNASMRKLSMATGDTLWTRTYDFNTDYPKYANLTTTSDNGIILTGYTSDGESDLILAKTFQNGSMTGIVNHYGNQKPVTLKQNFPNPFSQQTELSFSLSKPEMVELYITDINSRRIITLCNHSFAQGKYNFVWDGKNANGTDCSSGIYYAILKTKNGIIETRKLIKTSRIK